MVVTVKKCFNCGETGLFKRDCPKPPKDGNPQGSNGGKQKHWTKVKPAEGQPQSKTVNGVEYLWCDKCGRWCCGDKKHTTANHKTKAELQANEKPNQGGNTGGGASANVGGLRMIGTLLTGQIKDSSLN